MHTIPSDMTVLEALEHCFPDSSRRSLQQWVKEGRVDVNGSIIKKANEKVAAGQPIRLLEKENKIFFNGISILYQDRWMVVIEKPAGLLSVPVDDPQKRHALGLVREQFGSISIFPVHRIDRETSGVLLFARGTLSQEKFDVLFEGHLLEREYLGIVEGQLNPSSGSWEHYLEEKENYDVVLSTPERGRLAITHFEVYRRSKQFSYLRLKLETGRKHQIRVQCREAGHPIVGDSRYGSTCNPLGRMGLHAHRLSFIHPFTGKQMEFISSFPYAFKRLGAHLCDEKLINP